MPRTLAAMKHIPWAPETLSLCATEGRLWYTHERIARHLAIGSGSESLAMVESQIIVLGV